MTRFQEGSAELQIPRLRSETRHPTLKQIVISTGAWRSGEICGFFMKIADVQTVVVNAEMRNWIFVKVVTDQAGLFGWGEASLEWKTRAVVGAIEDFAPMIIGEDPRNIEHLYQKLYRHSFFRMGVIGMSAISGIEQACWDILGKSLNVPVYRLLRGNVRDRVRMYTHLGGGN